MSELAIKMTSDDQQVSAAVQRLDQGVKQVEKSFDSAAVASQRSADAAVRATTAQSKLAAEGKRIADSLLRQNEDLSESWERQKNAINEAHRDGKLSAHQHQRALELLEKKISDTAAANRAKARAATEAAETEKRAALESTDAYQLQQREIKEGIALTQRLEDKNRTLSERYDILRQRIKAAFDGGKISAEQYRTAIDQVTEEQRELEEAQEKSVGPSALAMVGRIAAGYFGLSQILSMITDEMEHQSALRKEAQQEALTLGEAQAGMVRNLGPVPRAEVQRFSAQVNDIAFKYNMDAKAVTTAASAVLSATGSDQAKTIKVLDSTAGLFPDRPEALGEFAQRVPGIADALGTSDYREAVEFMLSMQSQFRLVDPQMFRNAAQAVASSQVSQSGADSRNSILSTSAMFAGIGQTLDDAEGSITKTAVVKLQSVLENIVGDRGREMTGLDRLAIAQSDDSVRAAVLKAFGENEATGVVRDLLTKGSKTALAAERAASALTSSAGGYSTMMGNIQQGTPELIQLGTSRANDSSLQQRNLSSPQSIAALRQSQYDLFTKAIQSTDNWNTFRWMDRNVHSWAWSGDQMADALKPYGNSPADEAFLAQTAEQLRLLERQIGIQLRTQQLLEQQQNPNQIPVTRPNEDK